MNAWYRGARTTRAGQGFVVLLASLSLGGCLWGDGLAHGDGYYGGSPSATPASPAPIAATPPSVDMPSECIDASGFGGRGCYTCAATTSDQLLAACTTSRFEDFDNAKRIAGFDPANPKPPRPSLGPTPPPFDPGTSPGTDPGTPAPACPIATKPNPVMVLGATGFPMEAIAKAMGAEATIFFQEKGSCDGVATIVLNQKLSGEVVFYDADGTKNRCMLQEDHPADITLSALFAETCANQSGLAEPVALPSDVADFLGPVNPVMFAVPATSKERAISAEAAYKVYGFGPQAGVAPWNDEQYVYRRRASSGNQQTVALTLGLPADALRGRDAGGSSNMLTALLQSSAPQQTIGISSSEIVDPNRDVMKTLAYKHYKQPVAFYPDSDPASLDRRNVRDGHYCLWIPLHLLARTRSGDPVAVANVVLDPDGSKKAARDASVKRLAFVMTSRQQAPVPSVDLFGALKRVGNVPQCAMKVRRSKEGAPLESYTPAVSCDCAFEAALPGTTRPDCTPCSDSSQCSSGRATCSFGFCE